MLFRKLTDGLSFAEGPIALGNGGVLCVEVLAGRLTSIAPDGSTRLVANLGYGPNGAAIGPDGRCYVANNGGLTAEDLARLRKGEGGDPTIPPSGRIQAVDITTGRFETLYDHCGGKPLIAPNDLVFDASGGFYFTDYGSLRQPGPQRGRIYYATAAGDAIRDLGRDMERPNGIGLSPACDCLYVAETSSGRLWSFAVTEPGVLAEGQGDATLVYEDRALQMDSLAVQADGKVCIACPHNDLIVRISPGGDCERFPTPSKTPSNICFGGPDLRTAYVTCLQPGVVLLTQWDSPGLALAFGADAA
ncbi:MAG: SMP-30/gluconolactonase/LRE family protein [Novosphingobium sp.]|nr:SMP-30/gluconolactonase/LRE family protein [Novosphingobium sp.]